LQFRHVNSELNVDGIIVLINFLRELCSTWQMLLFVALRSPLVAAFHR
jgi:hypothetical protein